MFAASNTVDRDRFLESARAARLERELDRCQGQSSVVIQAAVRSFLARRRLAKRLNTEIVESLAISKPTSAELFHSAQKILFLLRNDFKKEIDSSKAQSFYEKYTSIDQFLLEKHRDVNSTDVCKHFEKLCKQIILSMFSQETEHSYVGAPLLNPLIELEWMKQCKRICYFACLYLRALSCDQMNHSNVILVYLNILVSLTSVSSWQLLKNPQHATFKKRLEENSAQVLNHLIFEGAHFYQTLGTLLVNGLSGSKPALTKLSLVAIMTLSIRIAQYKTGSTSQEYNFFLKHIFSVPALLHHLNLTASETIQVMCKEMFVINALDQLINSDAFGDEICKFLRGSYTLCFVGNIVNFIFYAIQSSTFNEKISKDFSIKLASSLRQQIDFMQNYVLSKQSSLTNWHPVLGWFSQTLDKNIHESMSFVKIQLQYLWNPQMIQFLFTSLFEATSSSSIKVRKSSSITISIPEQTRTGWRNTFLGKALEKATTNLIGRANLSTGLTGTVWNSVYTLDQTELTSVSSVTWMYQTAINTFSQMKHDILAGLSYKEVLLPQLWTLITVLGPHNPCHAFLSELDNNFKPSAKEFSILILFCECATHLITILDDVEMYENQKPFTLDDLVMISHFLNNFVYRLIQSDFMSVVAGDNPLLSAAHSLLMCLYKRDCRRPFAPKDHWLIRELRVSSFMKDLEQNKEPAKTILAKIPHVIPHKDRVILFRKLISADKEQISIQAMNDMVMLSTLINVNRSRIVEDGYHQLNSLPPLALKGLIRVKFVNEQGLDEAGIDQDGVFKEFLEDTIKKVFDPSLNLFKVTSEQRLYPSPTSYMQDNHLSLFEFVGKMIGKAVYEGTVVDVPFASFFLSQVLGQQQSSLYSSIDELPSLDAGLYKSLTYLKHYNESDISLLGLTFSVDEDCMGEIVTHELLHGGRAIPLTNETRISYIHLMAHFRMHTQIHEQTAAFIRGFRSIIKPDFLLMFSTPEFQRLISGDNSPIDIDDLKRHTKYFGGFHSQHRVISWLWDILEKEFNADEHRLFLKFVTSCSKPPLLGFAHLEPPFSIRCVEVGEDQDTGDTVGSVLRGFFTIRRKDPVNRLPTSSTCFNLLKLPNYQKKATLKEKLRYAINSNTGFELS